MESYELAIAPWIERFPLRNEPASAWAGGTIASVRQLAIIEQLRELASANADLGPQVPVDVFVFAKGEPARRDITKVGGLPYRPRGLLWPETDEYGPMSFVGQYRFTESKDIVGDLPGDLLLLFAVNPGLYTGREEPQYFHFEWYPAGLTDLVPPEDVPPPRIVPPTEFFSEKFLEESRETLDALLPGLAWEEPLKKLKESAARERTWRIPTWYGLRHRTCDYVDEIRGMQVLEQIIPTFHDVNAHLVHYWFANILRLNGMKIGGLPNWNDIDDPDIVLPGRHLCSLTDVFISSGIHYPWVNVAEPLSGKDWSSVTHLAWYDGGCVINFTIDDQGHVHWYAQAS